MASKWSQKVNVHTGADAGTDTLGSLSGTADFLRLNTDLVWANRPLAIFANNDIIRSVIGPHGGLYKIVSDASLVESIGYSDQYALVAHSRADIAGEPDGNSISLKTTSDTNQYFASVDVNTIATSTGAAGQFVAGITLLGENDTKVSEVAVLANSTAGTSLQVLYDNAGVDAELNVQAILTNGLSVDLTGFKSQGFDHIFRINDEDGIVTQFSPFVASGALAMAYVFNTSNTLAHNTSRIAQFRNNGQNQLAISPSGGLFRMVSEDDLTLWGGFTDQDALVSLSRADIAGEPDAHIIQLAATSDDWLYAAHVFLDANAASTGAAGSYNAQCQLSANNATNTIEIQSRIGTEVGAFINMLSIKAQSEAYNFRISDEDGVTTQFSPFVADGASAIAYLFDTSNTLSNATSRLSSWRNNGGERVTFAFDGGIVIGPNTETWQSELSAGVTCMRDTDSERPATLVIGSFSTASSQFANIEFFGDQNNCVLRVIADDAGGGGSFEAVCNTTSLDFRFMVNGGVVAQFQNTALTFSNAYNIVIGTGTGTKIGTGTTQKIGFWNAAPVVQPTNVTNPTGGGTIDAEARTAIDAILSRLETIGLFAA